MTNTTALRDRIEGRGYKLKFIAEKLGLSYQGFLNKLDNKSEFSASEISILCELLNITSFKDVEAIFLANKVDVKSTEE